MSGYVLIGALLGLSAGFAPGPLMTLVISETLQHGVSNGIKVAIVPVITDLPVIIVTFYLSARLTELDHILGMVSLAGGFFILYLACNNLRTVAVAVDINNLPRPRSIMKGILTNILSPHPYMFWLTVGAPVLGTAMKESFIYALVFVAVFYGCLVGSKIVLAVITGKSRTFLAGKAYIYTMKLLGVLLCLFSILLFHDGLQLLGMI
jgi:threonine/homoserine/homoserine lactone efflux protein